MKLTLTFKKSTKGTHVYEETVQDSPIPSLYIKRAQLEKEFGGEVPKGIVVTIEEVK